MRTHTMTNNPKGRTITRALAPLGLALALMALAASQTFAKTITVTGAGDAVSVDGLVTLREALTAANTNAPSGDAPKGDVGSDTIAFNINGGGVKTINLQSQLPTITEPVTINGYTQPGASPNTLAVGDNAVLLIELNGAGAGASASGLVVTGGDSKITGLVINRFGTVGISLEMKGDNVVAGNFIGTNASGDAAFPAPNNVRGIYLDSSGNTIGGATAAARNIISGNRTSSGGTGIFMDT